ncbi:MAG: zinc-ribbon domain-containing protein [Oscillospiraceae bacterium]|nr:zinc-ribbon domain-containing protein [Oscillospiraceae bacterium]
MFCSKCGKELADDSRFCDGCGTARQRKAVKAKKKFPVWIVIVVAAVLVVGITAAILLPILFPGTVTVYRPTSFTSSRGDGTQVEYTYEYDENGNPTRWGNLTLMRTQEAEYDDQGNLTERYDVSVRNGMVFEGTPSKYKYSYDEDGRIKSCKEYYDGNKLYEWDYTWDKKGNLVRVMLSEEPELAGTRIVRQDWEYDKEGRLITEYVCAVIYYTPSMVYAVYRYDYRYDDAGRLEAWEYNMTDEQVEDFEDLDYDALDFDRPAVYYEISYNEGGKIQSVETNFSGEPRESEFEYDSDGNLEYGDEYEYDENGNLLVYGSEGQNEFEYEAVEMSKEAAQRYYRWESLLRLNIWKTDYFPLLAPTNHQDMFYYYLIPNPIW